MRQHLKIAEGIAHLLDSRFKLGPLKFGLDPILGLFPIVGDVIAVSLSLYIVWIAKQMELPQEKLNKMIRNIIIDTFVGTIPVIGDLADFVIRSNEKNLAILRAHVARKKAEEAEEL